MLEERTNRTMQRVLMIVMLALGLLLMAAGQAAAQTETEREREAREDEERERERRPPPPPKVIKAQPKATPAPAQPKAAVNEDCNSAGVDAKRVECWVGKIKRGDKDLRGAFLVGANLKGAKLSGRDFSNANLNTAILIEAELQEANLAGARLLGTNFMRANLTGTNLADASPHGANFEGTILTGAKINDSAYGMQGATVNTKEWKSRGGIIITAEKPKPIPPRPRVSGPIDRVNLTGRVKFFNDLKGFGTITAMHGEGDCFVHHSAIKDTDGISSRTLVEGELVKFVRVTGGQNGPTCQDVVKIKESAGVSPLPLETPVPMMAVRTKERK